MHSYWNGFHRRRLGTPGLQTIGILCLLVAASSTSHVRAADTLCGTWKGHWESCTDQFKGTVKARITRCGPGCYKAVFTGRAFKVMPYRYTAMLKACRDPETGTIRFRCSRKLPFWGQYWMRGSVEGCCFRARYNTDDHVGYFVMRRVCSK